MKKVPYEVPEPDDYEQASAIWLLFWLLVGAGCWVGFFSIFPILRTGPQ